jgi:hypothetical protein
MADILRRDMEARAGADGALDPRSAAMQQRGDEGASRWRARVRSGGRAGGSLKEER